MKIFKTKTMIATLVALTGASVFAQGVSFPKIDSLASPAMPTIESPTIGGEYYKPGVVKKQTPQTAATNSTEDKSFKDKKYEELKKLADENFFPTLTADEVQSLNVNGVLENVLENIDRQNSKETDHLLKQVLSEMEEIKKQNREPAPKPARGPNRREVSQNTGSRLLRFKVNGYDVLHTCRTVFISDVQEDGTFLVTGDRRYQSDGATRSETFHLLFKAASGANGAKSYDAAAAVTQDYFNENSFLYQMSQKGDLQANRVGNLVILRTADADWKLELLIDLGATSR